MRLGLVVGAMIGLLAGGLPAGAESIFVATTGHDSAGTGSMARPYRTITRALERAGTGDVVELREGFYREAEEVRFRVPGVTLRSFPGEWAVVSAPLDDENRHSSCIQIDPDADRTVLSRLEIMGGYYYGVMLQTKWDWGDPADNRGACGVVIQDCVIHHTGRDAVKITPNCDDITIRRCRIYQSGVGPANVGAENAEGIDCVNGDRVRVQDCWIHDIFSTGIYLKGGSMDGRVERTRVERCGGGGILLGFDTSPEYFDLRRNPRYYENIRGTVRNCVVRDTGWEGIGMYAASNPAVYNNTLINVCTGGIHSALYFGLTYQDWDPAAGRPPTVKPKIFNNLIAQPAGFTDEMVEIRYSDDLGGMSALAGRPSMDYNGFYVAGGGARFTDRRPGAALEGGTIWQWRSRTGADRHSRLSNPRLVQGGNSNAQLGASSPYINRGTNAGWMVSATDARGKPRIMGRVVDIGAYEYVASTTKVLWVTPGVRTVPAGGGTATFRVANAGAGKLRWRAGERASWMAITGGAAGTNRGEVILTCLANASTRSRTGTVTVVAAHADGSPRHVRIVQAGRGRSAAKEAGTIAAGVMAVDSATWHVATNGSDAADGRSWATAKQTIQAAVDVAGAGDTVWVSNGVYETGSRVTPGHLLPNRVVITNDITVRSVNGPESTVIRGQGPRGPEAVRGVYLSAGRLIGFTVTNGHTRLDGDGTYDQNGGGINMASSTEAVVSNCVISGNRAYDSAGTTGGNLQGCVVAGNTAERASGGSACATLVNCLIRDNVAEGFGGGADQATLVNCTVTGNRAKHGGGAYNCRVFNSIVIGNDPFNMAACTSRYSCSQPRPWGTGNLDANPVFTNAAMGNYRLAAGSPCIDAGDNGLAVGGVDLDGGARIVGGTVDMGAYEHQQMLQIAPSFIQLGSGPATGIAIRVIATGHWMPTASAGWMDIRTHSGWDDGTFFFGVSANTGEEPRTGEIVIAGAGFYRTCRVVQASGPWNQGAWYVATNGNDAADGRSWATAKRTIQAGVDAAAVGDKVWVSNGVYAAGGRPVPGMSLTNRVLLDKPIYVQSVNGAGVTVIQGARDPGGVDGLGNAAVRCAVVGIHAELTGFTLRGGATRAEGVDEEWLGGGIFGDDEAVVNDCRIVGNTAGRGGGSYRATLNRCVFSGNSATFGGGAYHSRLQNSLLTGNSACTGGGACRCNLEQCTVAENTATARSGGTEQCILFNSIVYFNEAGSDANHYLSTINSSCTTPLPSSGWGNTAEDPLFKDRASGNFRLMQGSGCIDTADPAFAQGTVDLDRNPRIFHGAPDMGAYEFSPELSISPVGTNVPAGAVSGRIVEVEGNLAWTAFSTVRWLAIESGDSGTGAGRVTYRVEANDGTQTRTGMVLVSGGVDVRTHTVVQAAPSTGLPEANLAIRNLEVARPANAAARSFTACQFDLYNHGPSRTVGTVRVAFYLSRDNMYGNADDRKIGETDLEHVEMRAGSVRTVKLGSTLYQVYGLWNPGLAETGDYYVWATAECRESRDPNLGNNRTRTSGRFRYYAGSARVDLAIRNLRVERPSNSASRRFAACSFRMANRGPALRRGVVRVEFYLSKDLRFGNADDVKIGATTFTGLSLASGTSRSVSLGRTRLGQIVDEWTAGRVGAGRYYVLAQATVLTAAEIRPGDNRTRTDSPFRYMPSRSSTKSEGSEWAGSCVRAWARAGDGGWMPVPELVDGDAETVWEGEGAGPWAVAVDLGGTVELEGMEIEYAGEPWESVNVLGTENLLDWFDLKAITNPPVPCRAVFFDFQRDGEGGRVPSIGEMGLEY